MAFWKPHGEPLKSAVICPLFLADTSVVDCQAVFPIALFPGITSEKVDRTVTIRSKEKSSLRLTDDGTIISEGTRQNAGQVCGYHRCLKAGSAGMRAASASPRYSLMSPQRWPPAPGYRPHYRPDQLAGALDHFPAVERGPSPSRSSFRRRGRRQSVHLDLPLMEAEKR